MSFTQLLCPSCLHPVPSRIEVKNPFVTLDRYTCSSCGETTLREELVPIKRVLRLLAGLPPGAELSDYAAQRRARLGRYMTVPEEITSTDVNSSVDQSAGGLTAPPIIAVWAGGVTPAANALATSNERFNSDPFVYWQRPKTGDAMFLLPIYMDALVFTAQAVVTASAGSLTGISIGKPNAAPLSGSAGALSAVRISLSFRHDDLHWQAEVCNKWAASGHKQKFVDLGIGAGVGIPTPVGGQTNRLEILYTPNTKVEFYIDGIKVYTFTDANDGGGDTPLGDIYAHGAAVGSTIGGMSIFTMTGSSVGSTLANFAYIYGEVTVPS